jgi:hypothetical protein
LIFVSCHCKRTDLELERPKDEPKADTFADKVGLNISGLARGSNTADVTLGTLHSNDGIDKESSVCSSYRVIGYVLFIF